jgi:hypothetical protein
MTVQVIHNSLLTIKERVSLANGMIRDWSTSNVYVGIGGELSYPLSDTLVPVPNQSQNYINSVYRNLIALKKITAADMAFVVPRIDWQSGIVYDAYDSSADMYGKITYVTTNGTVNVSNSRTITGTNTTFLSQFSTGNFVYLSGDGLNVSPQVRQVIDIFSNTSMNVNSAFTGQFVQNTAFIVTDSSPKYSKNFYVRNAYDQVFICLFNNGGIQSTVMPQISVGGELPEKPYIITADGYKWKYLYTIPSGQKKIFFSKDWMPVFRDTTVVQNATDGQIDVVLIVNGGSGYNQNVASNTASILTVQGDGSGANLTAKVDATGKIFDINVLNGGSGYTTANVIVQPGSFGSNANLSVVIGPQNGHGFDPVEELGATSMMLSVELSGTESGTIPTGASVGTGIFEYRQIVILKDPKLSAGGIASNANYSTITTITTQPLPSGKFFSIDETVYQGVSLEEATFSASVVFWDDTNDVLWLNNMSGTFTPQSPIIGTIQTSPVTAFLKIDPTIKLFTGKVLYLNNVLPIIRGANQTEQVRAIFSF